MPHTLIIQLVLSAGAVWIIAALVARLTRKSMELEQAEKEALEHEKMEKIHHRVSSLGDDDVRRRLQNLSDK